MQNGLYGINRQHMIRDVDEFYCGTSDTRRLVEPSDVA
jgi:hypothetical protein